jgi:hypothetical protein
MEQEEKQRQLVEEQQRQEQERRRVEQEEARLRQQAETLREQRRRQDQDRRDEEQRYLQSIPKGVPGVTQYLQRLRESCTGRPQDLDVAVRSLCTIFEQIYRHPEEASYRRIRKDHPRVHQDVGRHSGGVELLIAAGFRPTMAAPSPPGGRDDRGDEDNDNNNDDDDGSNRVACLVSREPNIETDMDGWTEWYDLNKATYELLRTEVETMNKK